MWPFKSRQEYHAVAGAEDEVESYGKTQQASAQRKRSRMWMWSIIAAIVVAALLIIAITIVSNSHIGSFGDSEDVSLPNKPDEKPNTDEAIDVPTPSHPQSYCPLRKEWRTLSRPERESYISAVLCLRTQSSTLAPESNHTAYDDFPWIHSHVGYYTHNSAPFLPWHRYFLHVYEIALREKCDYTGSLVYWDWTLDSEELEKSPVFDAETGFGGDGEVGAEITVGRSGRCVVDGPFAGITADYYDVKYQPHCLSRGFRDLDGNLGHIDGHDISPESIEEVLSMDDYESFVATMESRVHDAIPFGIAGDFETFTAPYDPLFYLHHTQLDRLWWLWQQRQPDDGLSSYGGHKQRHSMEMASLDDALNYRGLAPDIQVKDVMDIENDLLCYRILEEYSTVFRQS